MRKNYLRDSCSVKLLGLQLVDSAIQRAGRKEMKVCFEFPRKTVRAAAAALGSSSSSRTSIHCCHGHPLLHCAASLSNTSKVILYTLVYPTVLHLHQKKASWSEHDKSLAALDIRYQSCDTSESQWHKTIRLKL